MSETGLTVKRHRVIHFGPDAAARQVRAHHISLGHANHKLMVHVRTACGLDGQTNAIRQSGRRHELAVRRGIGAPLPVPVAQMRQLHAQHRRLQRIEPEIAADGMMHVFRLRAVIAQQPHARREPLVHGRHEPAVAKAAEVLRWKKRKAADRAERARGLSMVGRTNRLRGVLDDGNAAGEPPSAASCRRTVRKGAPE